MLIKILLFCLRMVYCGCFISYYEQRNLGANVYCYIFIDKVKGNLLQAFSNTIAWCQCDSWSEQVLL